MIVFYVQNPVNGMLIEIPFLRQRGMPANTDFLVLCIHTTNQFFRSKYRLAVSNTHQCSDAKNAGRW